MDSATKNAGATMTPTTTKDKNGYRSKNQEPSKYAENLNPNNNQTPVSKPISNSCSSSHSSSSPIVKKSCSKYQKKPQAAATPTKNNHPNNQVVVNSPQNKIRQRKFVVAKKKNSKKNIKNEEEGGGGAAGGDGGSTVSFCKCKESKKNKCLCVAYQNLRKSQEEFFKKRQVEEEQEDGAAEIESVSREEEQGEDCCGLNDELGNVDLAVKRRRERLMEEARENVPQGGSGKVLHLVKAFEKLLSVSTENKDQDQKVVEKEPQEEVKKKVMKWSLPGLPLPNNATENEDVTGSFCPPQLILTSENLGLDPRASVSSSWDSSRGSCSVSSRTSNGGRRSRRNSLESSSTFGGSRWKKKQLKVTSQKPFKLRTEERGKLKEEEFVKKIQGMMTEEEKQRIPIAQGLPWTTDEPECLVKPPVKESTRPIDLKLHSDVRAMDRAEFDHQVAEKLTFIEQYKLERERQHKLAEEEEIRRLRKELIPKAQPMPYFDRPYIPRRSMKNPTIPREPKFHVPHHKKIKCGISSWNDTSP